MTENTLEKTIEAGLVELNKYEYDADTRKINEEFLRRFALTIAQATHDAVRDEADRGGEFGSGWAACLSEMHERFTRFISGV